jgi:linoleoyl-CoA desaturase
MIESSLQRRVRFPRDDGFHAALKNAVGAYFARTGHARAGGRRMHAKTAIILGWFAASYASLLAFGGTSGWLAAALTASLALATAGIGFSVMHDANHGAYSSSAALNRGWALALDFIGASSYVWRFKHNVQHHTYTNIDGMDADVDAEPFLRLAPSQRLRSWHRLQHVYAWPLYGALTLRWWFLDDAVDLARGRVAGTSFRRPRGFALATVLAGKLVFFGWALVVPALVFRSAWVAPFFLGGAVVLGFVLSFFFQLAHTVPEARFHAAGTGSHRMPSAWAEHQVCATADFAPRNRLLSWYVGGLNFQVEHHLFPDVCHVHYPALAPIVEAVCAEHGVPYRATPTLGAAVAAHLRHLRAMGRAAISPHPALSMPSSAPELDRRTGAESAPVA